MWDGMHVRRMANIPDIGVVPLKSVKSSQPNSITAFSPRRQSRHATQTKPAP